MVTDSVGHLLFGKTRQAVLGLLLTHPDESFHLRQIVRMTGAGLGPAQREAVRLAQVGLIIRRQRGRQVFYGANRESPVYAELSGLVVKTAGIADVLRAALEPLKGSIRVAFIFGSFAAGRQASDSDIDLLVVAEMPFATLAKALGPAQQRLAREINPTVYSPDELAKKLAGRHHFLTRVFAGPKIFLVGDEHELSGMAKERLDSTAPAKRRGDRRSSGSHRS